MRVRVDPDRCGGHGICVAEFPELFRLTDDGWAEAINDDIPAEDEQAARIAVTHCPAVAIIIDESLE